MACVAVRSNPRAAPGPAFGGAAFLARRPANGSGWKTTAPRPTVATRIAHVEFLTHEPSGWGERPRKPGPGIGMAREDVRPTGFMAAMSGSETVETSPGAAR